MRIALAASPLAGLRSAEVAGLFEAAWKSRRPGDEFDVRLVSDGVAQPYSGSGLADMLGLDEPVVLGQADSRRFAWLGGSRVLLDYTAGLPDSSREVGADIAWALGQSAGPRGAEAMSGGPTESRGPAMPGGATATSGESVPDGPVREVILALPVMAPIGDLGAGMIAYLAGQDAFGGHSVGLDGPILDGARRGEDSPNGSPAEPDRHAAASMLRAARKAVASVHITAFAGGQQRLLGLSGLARAWMRQGMDSAQAQELEVSTSRAAARMKGAFQALGQRELLGRHDLLARQGRSGQGLAPGPYDGVGGGLALGLRALGARVLPVGQAVSVALDAWASDADLCIYVCGQIGQSLPEGLNGAVEHAQAHGVPLVLVCDSGSVRRGELARLGLNAAYELRPGRALSADEDTPDSLALLSDKLRDLAGRLATTWGWD